MRSIWQSFEEMNEKQVLHKYCSSFWPLSNHSRTMKDISHIPTCLLFIKLKYLWIITHWECFPFLHFEVCHTWLTAQAPLGSIAVFLGIPTGHFTCACCLMGSPSCCGSLCHLGWHGSPWGPLVVHQKPGNVGVLWQSRKPAPMPVWVINFHK